MTTSTWTNMMKMYGSVLRSGTYAFQELMATYGPRVAERKLQVQNIAKAGRARLVGSELSRKLSVAHVYYSAELSPPKLDEMKKLREDMGLMMKFIRCNCWKDLTVRQAWLLVLVAFEILFWFYIGECIGKFRIVGYSV